MNLLLLLAIAGLVYLLVKRRSASDSDGGYVLPQRRSDPRVPKQRPSESVAFQSSAATNERPPPLTFRVEVGGMRSSREAKSDARWVPPGETVEIQGRTLTRGMVYVGRTLESGRGWGQEPSLLDPTRSASKRRRTEPLSYYPSYGDFSPAQRGRHLDWLAAGAEDPDQEIGYVFVYFYGLERRYFLDRAPADEQALLYEEVERLLSLYGDNGSFNGYARRFLAAADALDEDRLYETTPDLAPRWEPDVGLKLALGQAVVDGVPIPADWALLWLYQHPETSLRTPAKRCPDEMRALFRHYYAERYGNGLVVKPNKTRLKVDYRAASTSFTVRLDLGDLPDVTALSRPVNQLRPLLERAIEDLDAYSRFVGRNPEKRKTRESVGFLPRALASELLVEMDDPFTSWVQEAVADGDATVVTGDDLVERWGLPKARLTKGGALRKRDAEALGGLLDLLDVGIEPDVRRGGTSPRKGRPVVLFQRSHVEAHTETDAARAADVAVTLLAVVAHADGEVTEPERTRTAEYVREGLGLERGEADRLSARLALLLARPPTLRGVAEAAEQLTPSARRAAADLALLTAVADGRLEPAESRALERVYGALGLDSDAMYSDLHALRAEPAGSEPAVVRPASTGAPGHALPAPPDAAPPEPDSSQDSGFALDMDLVRAKLADTQKAAVLLAGVFAEGEDDEEPDDAPTPVKAGEAPGDAGVVGLDASHAALLLQLVEQEEWPREAYEAAAAEHNLMPGGALEVLNEWAFDHLDDALIEDGDPVLIYHDVWEAYTSNA